MNRAERRRQARYLRQPYVRRLRQAIAAGALPLRPGSVVQVAIAHDAWCPLLAGRGPCACSPAVEAVWPDTGARR